MKPYQKTVQTDTFSESIVNPETGELETVLTEVRTRTVLVNDEKEYVQFYTAIHGLVDGLTTTETSVMFWLGMMCDRENKIILVKSTKKELAKNAGLSEKTIGNLLNGLVKKEVIYNIDRATYLVNPIYVWKTSTNKRDESIKFVLELKKQQRDIGEAKKELGIE